MSASEIPARPVRIVALHGKPFDGVHRQGLTELIEGFRQGGAQIYLHRAFEIELAVQGVQTAGLQCFDKLDELLGLDLLIAVGGDGTVLESAALLGDRQVPVLGVNTGRLGFLSHAPMDDLQGVVRNLLQGRYTVESRYMLESRCEALDIGPFSGALNEITLHRRDTAAMIHIELESDGTFINKYWADGLIVSTPTGSTAYSLSCGGPIVDPKCDVLLITPIAPHNLNNRPLIIPGDGCLQLSASCREGHLMLTLDSRSFKAKSPLELTISRSKIPMGLVQMEGQDFYQTIRQKMHWGLDGRDAAGETNAAEDR
jgi:NAD+ kinase